VFRIPIASRFALGHLEVCMDNLQSRSLKVHSNDRRDRPLTRANVARPQMWRIWQTYSVLAVATCNVNGWQMQTRTFARCIDIRTTIGEGKADNGGVLGGGQDNVK